MIIIVFKDKDGKEYAYGIYFPWDKTICGVCGEVVPKGNYCDKCGSSLIINRYQQDESSSENR